MNRKIFIVIALLAILGGVAIVSAAISQSIHWTQTLTVPQATFTVTTASTTLSNGTDLGNPSNPAFWTWNGVAFTMTITIENTGTSTITPTVAPSGLGNWQLTTSTINPITQGNSEPVTLTVTPPDVNAGTTSGPFTITVSA